MDPNDEKTCGDNLDGEAAGSDVKVSPFSEMVIVNAGTEYNNCDCDCDCDAGDIDDY